MFKCQLHNIRINFINKKAQKMKMCLMKFSSQMVRRTIKSLMSSTVRYWLQSVAYLNSEQARRPSRAIRHLACWGKYSTKR